MPFDTDVVVVGAGVVGLAIARALARSGREVIVLEREGVVGTATSSRNSGVIHAGIYYPANSLKARLCVRGNALLYDYCAARGVSHRRCGKLIVATRQAEEDTLRHYLQVGQANGARDLRWLDAREVAELEPLVRCTKAVHSPSTGIVDAHELMSALQADIDAGGGNVALRTALVRAQPMSGGFELTLADPGEVRMTCRELINSAGLDASAVAARIGGLDARRIPTARYARGHYYALAGAPPFRQLVYPIPESAGLGIHATPDLSGRVRFGPDVEWIDGVDYRFGSDRSQAFATAIRRYYPALDVERLSPDYTGIRPKISGVGEPAADFRIDGQDRHGIPGLVNLFGIESPGLTSSLAIADEVRDLLDRTSGA